MRIAALLFSLLVPAISIQHVCISFDGSKQAKTWNHYFNMSREWKEKGYNLHFTFFISGVYFISKSNSFIYNRIVADKTKSLIGYGVSPNDILERATWISKLQQDGHEIGSHDNGHHFGKNWTREQWKSEIEQFRYLISNWPANNGFSVGNYPLTTSQELDQMVGHRPPNLEINQYGLDELKSNEFTYNLSEASHILNNWITTNQNGIYNLYHQLIPVSFIREDGSEYTRRVIAMDYNLYVHNSFLSNTNIKQSTITKVENHILSSFLSYFNSCYTNSSHPPVQLSFHFSDMHDGIYLRALERFISITITNSDVQFVTYQHMLKDKLTPISLTLNETKRTNDQ